MTIKDILKNIFSITDIDFSHSLLCIMGIKIKLPKKVVENPIYNDLPVNNKKIIFKTSAGSYSCNPKYIAEEIMRRNLPYELVWSVNRVILNYKEDFPEKIKIVMEHTLEEYKEVKTAKIIIDNERRTKYLKHGIFKRNNQIYIQTFHGSMGFKKTGPDRNEANKINWRIAKMDSSQIDYLTSNSKWETDFFKRMFFDCGKIIETGHARNDILFKDNALIKEKVFKHLNIPADKKVILYAPTLRENRDMSCYTLDYEKVRKIISEKFGGEWVFVTKLHPLMIDYCNELDGENFINATKYSDIQELLATADIVISDYSSCLLDFILTRRPAFIYATDEKKYDNGRGLYYSLRSTPFPVANNNDEMIENIKNFDYNKYKNDTEEFLKGKGCIEDGHASERIVDLIEKIINGDI